MRSTLKILIIVLIITALVAVGYFGYRYFQNKKTISNNEAPASTSAPQMPQNVAIGMIKEVSADSVLVTVFGENEGTDKTYTFASDLVIQKLQKNADTGVDAYVSADKSYLKTGQNVWIVFDETQTDMARTIKITDLPQ